METPWLAFNADAQENFRRLSSDDSQLNRRNYIRSTFAAVEATLAHIRADVAHLIVRKSELSGKFDAHGFVPLLDEMPRIQGTGKLSLEPNRVAFLPLVAYTLRKYAEFVEIEPGEFFSQAGWDALRNAVKVRHRITHPKLGSDIDVRDEDLVVLEAARSWWNDTVRRVDEASKRL